MSGSNSDQAISRLINPVITQALLQQLLDTRDRAREVALQAKACRRQVLELHALGARVETGSLVLRVTASKRRPITQADIVSTLGQEALDRVMADIAKKSFQTVIIKDLEHTSYEARRRQSKESEEG